ncbi:helix-turn-helix domain-containing protein [Micromonospora humidisoli]|uniref:Helix-turn-helix transcriptional regulator n=1 Tax=Micromonospora humidisoli TaxID=2807622 RepID=A0ABS2JLZ0_9ACTN|nr:helix-turn-helix transcriptional regulator [Micromonospora humidisoli]MBM7086869.1 helix-turn-helix transcriptional regulator [Micromonospora humidisoli]
MSLLRRVIGGVLRRVRLRQGRTLREVAAAAGVSLPYLSEVERGRKEASSEVLAAICRALGINLSDLLEEARDELRRVERRVPVPPGGSLARLDRVPTARRDGTTAHLSIGRPTVGSGRPGGGVPSTVGGAGFAVTRVATPVRVVAVASAARPAARTARVPARRWARTGRRRLPVG